MEATLTELRRATKGVSRSLARGESVELTEHGRTIGRINPEVPVIRVTMAEWLECDFTDDAIVEAVNKSRE